MPIKACFCFFKINRPARVTPSERQPRFILHRSPVVEPGSIETNVPPKKSCWDILCCR
ncbi:MAG: hypothetical protein K0Q57_389 [Gammaproteobacteria bacterium]|jgi:hypothetical protein|nr:hypothetical protein [Gammaproteobacteria bacterium]